MAEPLTPKPALAEVAEERPSGALARWMAERLGDRYERLLATYRDAIE